MAARKKKPAHNPRNDARKFVKDTMASILKKQAVFMETTEFLSHKVDHEREVAEAIAHDELKMYTLKALDEAQAAFLAMCVQSKQFYNQLTVDADSQATAMLNTLNDPAHKWKEIKEQYTIDYFTLSDMDQRAQGLAMDVNGTAIEIFSTYNAKVRFIKQAINNGHSVAEAETLLAQAVANNAQTISENVIVDHNDVEVISAESVEEKEHV